MFGYGGMMNGLFGVWSTFGFLTWVALIVFLILGIAFFWQQINKPKGRKK